MKMSPLTDDPVNPKHYSELGEYSALHVIHKWELGYCLGSALKYIQRAGKKPGTPAVVDLKKAVWYIQREIHILDPDQPDPAAAANRPSIGPIADFIRNDRRDLDA
jgi:hypothetical protein